MPIGLEVAGVVLATFPLLLKGLKAYVEAIQTVKLWRRYKFELRGYAQRLSSQSVRYINTLETLFDGIVESEEELAALIYDPDGDAWQQPKYDSALRYRLDHGYDHFLDILNSMLEMLEHMTTKLDIREGGKVSRSRDKHAFWAYDSRLNGLRRRPSNARSKRLAWSSLEESLSNR